MRSGAGRASMIGAKRQIYLDFYPIARNSGIDCLAKIEAYQPLKISVETEDLWEHPPITKRPLRAGSLDVGTPSR